MRSAVVEPKRPPDSTCPENLMVDQPVHRHLFDPQQHRDLVDREQLITAALAVSGIGCR